MSLDFYLTKEVLKEEELYSGNATHNLTDMAKEAGLYEVLWRPHENGYHTGKDCIDILTQGFELLKSDPERFEKHNPENHWGTYEGFMLFVRNTLAACIEYPDAKVSVWI